MERQPRMPRVQQLPPTGPPKERPGLEPGLVTKALDMYDAVAGRLLLTTARIFRSLRDKSGMADPGAKSNPGASS